MHCIENDSAEFKILLKLFPIVSGRARNHAPNLEIHSVFSFVRHAHTDQHGGATNEVITICLEDC